MEKAKDRLEVLDRIDNLEKQGVFDVDVENDPPAIVLMPNKVDYLNKKLTNKIKTKVMNHITYKFFEKLIKDKKLIINDAEGIENFLQVKGGAIITANHFNPFDNYVVYRPLRPYLKRKTLYKVIREGNYTSMPGFYGKVFKYCNTLPLSSNKDTMKLFLKSVAKLLKKGHKILIYPEQAMWWNYKKPRPLKDGAFKIASRNNVPIIPCFITMEETDMIGDDGFNILAHTLHIFEPIYPKKELTIKENVEYLKEKNFLLWKQCYEQTYGKQLKYKTA